MQNEFSVFSSAVGLVIAMLYIHRQTSAQIDSIRKTADNNQKLWLETEKKILDIMYELKMRRIEKE